MLNLPTTAPKATHFPESDTPRVTLPVGSYPARLKGFFLDDNTHYKTDFHYQEIKPIWEVYAPDHVPAEQGGFTEYWDSFLELDLRPEWKRKDGSTGKASVFIRRINAALAMTGSAFVEGSQLEYLPNEHGVKPVGDFPVYRRITLKEKEAILQARKEAGEKDPKLTNAEEFKLTDEQQTIYRGMLEDIRVDDIGVVGLWASLNLGQSADGQYNKLGSNDVKPLSSMEVKALIAEGLVDHPNVQAAKKAPPVGAPV